MLREERTILWRTSSVCLGLAMPAIMLGNSIMYALFGVGVISGLLATKDVSLRDTVQFILKSKLILLVLALLASFSISAYLGINQSYSLHKVSQVVGIAVGSLALVFTLREMKGKYLNYLLLSLIIGTFGMTVLALMDAFLESYRLSSALHGADKALSVHRLNFYSSALVVMLPFIWAYYVRSIGEGAPIPKMTAPIVLPLTLATVFIAGGRAGWVAVVPSLIIFLVMAMTIYKVNFHARHWFNLFLTIVAGLGGYALSRGPSALMERMELLQGERGLGGGRWDIWNTAINHIFDKPMFGIGPNAFRWLPEKIDLHPHNFMLQILLETGVVGTVLFMAMLLFLLITFIHYAKGNIMGLAALSSFVAFWTAALFNKSIFDMEWLSLFILSTTIGWRVGWSAGPVSFGQVLSQSSFIKPFKKKQG